MGIPNQFEDFYLNIYKVSDVRVANWLFLSSPIPTIIIVCLYLTIVCYIGPKLLAKRDPINLGLLLPLYNFVILLLNLYVVILVFSGSFNAGYSYICTPLRTNSTDVNEMKVARAVWWHFLSKKIELFDTILILLRKRYHQISFLHVYHHATMPLLWWIGARWVAGGQSFFIVLINSLIHVIMYFYYGLSAFGPKMKKYLWWKKGMTILQMIQFCCILFHTATSLYVECPDYPGWMHWLVLAHCSSILILFTNFYYQSYVSRRGSTTQLKKVQ